MPMASHLPSGLTENGRKTKTTKTMKQETPNNTIDTTVTLNGKDARETKSRLYNLLFAGKISLKQYLQAAKEME